MNAFLEVLALLGMGAKGTYDWFKQRYNSWRDTVRNYWMRGDFLSRALAFTIAVGTIGLIGVLIYAFCVVAIGLIMITLIVQALIAMGRNRQ